jgi:hypothetical protein
VIVKHRRVIDGCTGVIVKHRRVIDGCTGVIVKHRRVIDGCTGVIVKHSPAIAVGGDAIAVGRLLGLVLGLDA